MKKIKIIILTLLVLVCNTFIWAQSCGTQSLSQAEKEQLSFYGNNASLIPALQQHGYDIPNNYLELSSNEREAIRLNNLTKDLSTPAYNAAARTTNSSCTMYYVPLKIFIYEDTDGTRAFTQAQVTDMIDRSNRIYIRNNIPIRLYQKCGISYVRNGLYNLPSNSAIFSSFLQNTSSDAYNIHIVHRGASGTAGMSVGNTSLRSLYVSATSLLEEFGGTRERNSSLLVHEIGHSFGLAHTHDCFLSGNNNSVTCSMCDQEPVDRNKINNNCLNLTTKLCEIKGDLLADTEASPDLYGSSNGLSFLQDCSFRNSGSADHWGDAWKPQVRNCMAYTYGRCQDEFTLMQIAVMIKNLRESGLDLCGATSVAHISAVTGSSICPSEDKTFTIVGAQEPYTWELMGDDGVSFLSAVNGNTITVSIRQGATDGIRGTLMARPASCCECIPLSLDFESLPQPSSVFIGSGPNDITQNPTTRYTYRLSPAINMPVTWSVPPGWAVVNTGIPIYGVFNGGSTLEVQVPPGAISGTVRAESDCNIFCSKFVVVRTQSGALTCILQSQTIDGDALTTAPPTIDVDVENGGNALRIEVDNSTETYPAKIHKLYDGTLVKEFDVEGISTKNISELPSGLYFARFYIPNCPFNVRFAKF